MTPFELIATTITMKRLLRRTNANNFMAVGVVGLVGIALGRCGAFGVGKCGAGMVGKCGADRGGYMWSVSRWVNVESVEVGTCG